MSTPTPVLVTAPTDLPVLLTDLAEHLRVVDAQEYPRLDRLLRLAVDEIQDRSGYQLCTATYDQTFDAFADPLRLDRPPLSSVTSVTYTDTGGNSQTLSTDVYEVVTDETPGAIRLKYGQSWPALYGHQDVVTVRFVCGWGGASDVPNNFRYAVQLYAEGLFDRRPDLLELALRLVPRVKRVR